MEVRGNWRNRIQYGQPLSIGKGKKAVIFRINAKVVQWSFIQWARVMPPEAPSPRSSYLSVFQSDREGAARAAHVIEPFWWDWIHDRAPGALPCRACHRVEQLALQTRLTLTIKAPTTLPIAPYRTPITDQRSEWAGIVLLPWKWPLEVSPWRLADPGGLKLGYMVLGEGGTGTYKLEIGDCKGGVHHLRVLWSSGVWSVSYLLGFFKARGCQLQPWMHSAIFPRDCWISRISLNC